MRRYHAHYDVIVMFCNQSKLKHSHVHILWRHYGNVTRAPGASRQLDCLFTNLFKLASKETLKLHITGHCEGNPPITGGFPLQNTSNAESTSISSRGHYALCNKQRQRKVQVQVRGLGNTGVLMYNPRINSVNPP